MFILSCELTGQGALVWLHGVQPFHPRNPRWT